METITMGRGSRVGLMLVDEKRQVTVEVLGWMTSQSWLV